VRRRAPLPPGRSPAHGRRVPIDRRAGRRARCGARLRAPDSAIGPARGFAADFAPEPRARRDNNGFGCGIDHERRQDWSSDGAVGDGAVTKVVFVYKN